MYESDVKGGRSSIAPEKLIHALLLQVLYSIRSERMLMEQVSYNMLVRWFAGSSDWRWTMRSVETARVRGHLSGEHFSVDGTPIQAWAGHKRFVSRTKSDDDSPPDGGAGSHENWHGEKRGNDTHESSTDSQAGPFRKSRSTGAMLCYMGHVLTNQT